MNKKLTTKVHCTICNKLCSGLCYLDKRVVCVDCFQDACNRKMSKRKTK